MSLKVVSSSLTIYPLMLKIKKIQIYKRLEYSFNLFLLLHTKYFKNYIFNLYLIQFYKTSVKINKLHLNNLNFKKLSNIKIWKKLIKHLININTSTLNNVSQIHNSHKIYYIYNTKSSFIIKNISKLHKIWVNVYILFYHIFFYKINLFIFGNTTCSKEILSFNFKNKTYLTLFFKLFKYSKTNLNLLIQNFFNLKIKILLFTNFNKYQSFIFFFKKKNFYLISLIPNNYNLFDIDLGIPIGNETLFQELFFFRFILQIKKNTNYIFFKKIKSFTFL